MTVNPLEGREKVEGREKEWTGGGSWILSTVLLTVGSVAGAVAIIFALVGGLQNSGEAGSIALAAAGTPLALGGLVLAAVGGVLRYCSYCWDCDWDEEDAAKTATTSP